MKPPVDVIQPLNDEIMLKTAKTSSQPSSDLGPQVIIQDVERVAGSASLSRRRKLDTSATNEGDDELSTWPPQRPKRTYQRPAHLRDFVCAIFATHSNLGVKSQASNVNDFEGRRRNEDSVPVDRSTTNCVTDVINGLNACSLSRDMMDGGWI